MAQKRFYWLKLRNDFFNDPKIKKLRRIAGGDTYALIYLKMQLSSLKDEGKLYFEGIEKSFEEELALKIDEDVDNVKVTVNFLKSYGLLEEKEENFEYMLAEVPQAIGTEGISTERVRKYRAIRREEEQKALQCNADVTDYNAIETECNTSLLQCNDIKKKRRDREDIEKEKKEKKEKTVAELISEFSCNEQIRSALNEWVKMRSEKKIRTTSYAMSLALQNLETLSDNDEKTLKIINNSVLNGWPQFYSLRSVDTGSKFRKEAKLPEYYQEGYQAPDVEVNRAEVEQMLKDMAVKK